MKSWLKRYFFPHPENDYKPHALRREIIAFVCVVALAGELVFLSGVSYLAPYSRLFGIILTNALVDETNQNRIADNLSPLLVNPLLQAAAREKADDMAKNGYFAHTSPAGITPWHWFENVGYRFNYAGENLAVNFSDSQDVTDAWMNSIKHRENILNGNFTEIGIATAQGEFNGRPAIYVVQFFGAPAAITTVEPEVSLAGKIPAPLAASLLPVSEVELSNPPAESAPTAESVAPAAPAVVAADSSGDATSQQSFVAVKGVETEAAPRVNSSPVVSQNNPIQKAAALPRRVANGFYFLLIGLFAAVLLFNLYAKLHLRHPKLIMNGAAVIAVAALCVFVNQYFTLFRPAIL